MLIIHRWEKQHTTGTPPPGVRGYGSCCIGTGIYYFGGYCGHDSCYHNSLFLLNTATLVWDELVPTIEHHGPMKKAYGALLAFDDQLLAFGGKGEPVPSSPSPLAKYKKYYERVYTNEHHLFHQKGGECHFLNTVTLRMLVNHCIQFRPGMLLVLFQILLLFAMVTLLMAVYTRVATLILFVTALVFCFQ